MTDIATYYFNTLNDLQTKYTNITQNYVTQFTDYKTAQLNFNISLRKLNSSDFEAQNPTFPYLVSKKNIDKLKYNYIVLTNDVKSTFMAKSESIQSIQKKIDILTSENEILSQEVSNIEDIDNASKPFFNNERELYYRSIIYLITITAGVIYILYLLQSTPFTEITKDLVVNTKTIAGNAINGVKGALTNGANVDPNNPNVDANSTTKNMIILLLVSIVVIAVFYFIVYLVRRAKPTADESKTEKEIKSIADSCKRDKSESWVTSEIDKIKNFLIKPDSTNNTTNDTTNDTDNSQ